MKEITYKILFHSEWHCGSGLSSGSDLDALVVKDAEGFPFIPGKTLKGLLKEAAFELIKLKNEDPEKSSFITELFGYKT
jgi:CRISPR/Cas system CMR subunit Cmr4 (Cas7 group RAMP superfamily)